MFLWVPMFTPLGFVEVKDSKEKKKKKDNKEEENVNDVPVQKIKRIEIYRSKILVGRKKNKCHD